MTLRFATIFVTVAAAIALTIVPAFSTVSATPRPQANSEVFTLTFWLCCNENTSAAPYPEAMALFKKQYPNATVNFVQKGRPEQHLSALQAAMMAHSEPDLYLEPIGNGDEGQFIKDGRQLNLGKYVQKYHWNKIYPASILATQQRTWHGVYGVPYDNSWIGIWYKKDVLQKYHLPVPTTYAQLLKDCAVFKENGIVPFLEAGYAPAILDRLIDAILEGNSPPSYRNALLSGYAKFNSPYLLQAFTMFQNDFVAKNYFQPGYLSAQEPQVYQIFLKNKGGFWLSGDWEWGTWASSKVSLSQFDMVPFPTGKDRIPAIQSGFFIDKSTKHADAAAALLNDIESPTPQHAAGKVNPALARLNSISTTGMVTDEIRSIRIFNTRPTYPLLNEVGLDSPMTDQLYTVTTAVATKQMTPQQAVNQLDKAASQYHWYK